MAEGGEKPSPFIILFLVFRKSTLILNSYYFVEALDFYKWTGWYGLEV